MNREIKFRAWDGSKMIYSENAEFYLMPNNKVQIPSSTGHEFYDKEYPLMQYTGRQDKNGKEIYEGDIVKGFLMFECNPLITMGVVEYCNEFAAYGLKNDAGLTLFHNHDIQSFEIIGNIYKNPSLLTANHLK